MRISPIALLTALASLSLAGGCKSDDAGGSKAPQQPTATAAAPAPAPAEEAAPADGEVAADPGAAPGGAAADPRDAKRQQRREEMVKKYDANGDGKLNKAERETMRREGVDRKMARMDRDGDGKISRDEASRGLLGRKLLADFAAADSNRDSFISRDELAAAIKVFQQHKREARLRGVDMGDSSGGAGGQPADQ